MVIRGFGFHDIFVDCVIYSLRSSLWNTLSYSSSSFFSPRYSFHNLVGLFTSLFFILSACHSFHFCHILPLAHSLGATAIALVAVFTISRCERTHRENCNGWQHTCHNFSEHESLHILGIKTFGKSIYRLPNEKIPGDRL